MLKLLTTPAQPFLRPYHRRSADRIGVAKSYMEDDQIVSNHMTL